MLLTTTEHVPHTCLVEFPPTEEGSIEEMSCTLWVGEIYIFSEMCTYVTICHCIILLHKQHVIHAYTCMYTFPL